MSDFGAVPSAYDVRDYKPAFKQTDLPLIFDLGRENFIVKNQNPEPTCTAHVVSSIIEYHTFKEGNRLTRFSINFIYGFKTTVETGQSIRDALKVANHYGDVPYDILPGNSAHKAAGLVETDKDNLLRLASPFCITNYYKIRSVSELKLSIINDGPAACGIWWYKDSRLKNNYYIFNANSSKFAHAVTCVGWTDDAFIFLNSWGRLWGDNGRFYIRFEDFDNVIFESYGVTDNDLSVLKPAMPIKIFSKLINLIVNIFRKDGGTNG